MPVYMFKCRICCAEVERHLTLRELEELGTIWTEKTASHQPDEPCEHVFRRVFTAPGIQFLGGGWACKGG